MGGAEWLRTIEYSVKGVVIGRRQFGRDGERLMETPLHNGVRHGIEYTWHENGQLELVEPYHEGLIHGTASQWDCDGRLLGQYTLVHGTGLDVWRGVEEDGTVHISEIQMSLNGKWHGYGWGFERDGVLYRETPWWEGLPHGIEREWDEHGDLITGSPVFFIRGEQVERTRYLAEADHDATLPPYREEDNRRDHRLPPEVSELFTR